MSHSKARYSAAVSAMRGVAMRSTAGSSARLRKSTERSIAAVWRSSVMKKSASSKVIPIAANTTANVAGSPAGDLAWRAICAASWLCGRPEPEKIGSF
jgi:hypothetical protein